jgi:flagellar hook-length control protein FliK
MSNSIPPASTGASAQGASAALGRGQGRGTAGAPGGTDLFALLMLQLGSDPAPSALTAGAQAAAGEEPVGAQDLQPWPPSDGAPNPLAGLLAWTAAAATDTGLAAANAGALTPAEDAARPAQALAAALSPAVQRPIGAHETDTAPAGAQAVPLPAGLQRLDTPAAADARVWAAANASQPGATAPAETPPANTLAATKASSESLRADTPSAAGTHTAASTATSTTALRHNPRAAHWRSTAALGQSTAPAGAAYRVDVLRNPADAGAGSSLTGMRSTVQLDERFAQDASSTEPPAGSLAAALQATQRAPGADRGVFSAPADAAVSAASEADGGGPMPQQDNAGSDQPSGETAQAAHEADTPGWSAQQLRQASLRVNAGEDSSIDIQLSLKGQEVQVSFRSDDAQTRASLAQESALLNEQLQRSGMTLGGVSVGAQTADGQSQGQRSGQPSTQATSGADLRGNRGGESVTRAAAPVTTAQPLPRADGSQPLDLFV